MLRTNSSTQTPIVHTRPPLHTDPLSGLTTSSAVIIAEIRKAEQKLLAMLGARQPPKRSSKHTETIISTGGGRDDSDDDDGKGPRLLRELLPIHLLDLHMLQDRDGGDTNSSIDDDESMDGESSGEKGLVGDASTRLRKRQSKPSRGRKQPAKNTSAFEKSAYDCDDATLKSYAAVQVVRIMQDCERKVAEQLENIRVYHEEAVLAAAGAAREAARKESKIRASLIGLPHPPVLGANEPSYANPSFQNQLPTAQPPSPIPKVPSQLADSMAADIAAENEQSRIKYQKILEKQLAVLRPSIDATSSVTAAEIHVPSQQRTPPPPHHPDLRTPDRTLSTVGRAWDQLAALGDESGQVGNPPLATTTSNSFSTTNHAPHFHYNAPRPHYTLDGQVYTPSLGGGAVPPIPMMTSSRARGYMAHLERIMASAEGT